MQFKYLNISLVFLILLCGLLRAEKHIAEGEIVTNHNRLISNLSPTGRRLYLPPEAETRKLPAPDLDGKALEHFWKQAQRVSPFVERTSGLRRDCSVLVTYDKENIYLFWEIQTDQPPKATVTLADTAIFEDSYIQLDLYPVLPDSIHYGRGYFYSVAVNPLGTVWDAYWDPYKEGFFFTSWDSRAKVATTRSDHGWTVEMVLPFSGLDLYSDPGWNWILRFHQSEKKLATAPCGIQLTQGVKVRRSAWVTYYWDRPELMADLQPNATKMFKTRRSVTAASLVSTPAVDGRMNEEAFAGSREIALLLRDDTAEPVSSGSSGSFKVAHDDTHIYFLLKAKGGKAKPHAAAAGAAGGDAGMAAQMNGVNGVFKDLELLSTEGFWVVLQPRVPGLDAVHQDYYFISLYNTGVVRGVHYDSDGIPDRSWDPGVRLDLFDTEEGWGAELAIPLAALEIPPGCGTSWGLNVFRNAAEPAGKQASKKCELAAWCPTRGHHYETAHIGQLEGLKIPYAGFARKTLEHRAAKLSRSIKKLKPEFRKKARAISKELKKLTRNLDKIPLRICAGRLDYLQQRLGQLKAQEFHSSHPVPEIKGYQLNDVFMLETAGKGWAVGRMGTLLYTEDGGHSWNRYNLGTSADLRRVQFVDELHGWIVGGRIRMGPTNEQMRHDQRGGYGYIFHTEDGGKTWQIQYAEQGRFLFGLYMLDAQRGWACGERGVLLKTEDAGGSWRATANSGTTCWLYDIEFLDEQRGFAVGQDRTLLATSDGGASWQAVESLNDDDFYGFRQIYRAVTFQGERGWIVGQNGTILGTTDGGRSWSLQTDIFKPELREFFDLENVCFADSERGWAVGRLGSRIMVTSDGGASWRLMRIPNRVSLSGIWLDKAGRAVAVGALGVILVTSDGGKNWSRVNEKEAKLDVLALMAHGDDGPLSYGTIYAYYSLVQHRRIGDIQLMRDWHSVEYQGETYNLEHNRSANLQGCVVSDYLDEFENGNNGCDYYHYTQRLWKDEKAAIREVVALIRMYRPEVVLTHEPVFGEYDKPGHKLAGRATLEAFETAGGEEDHWPELTRLGLGPWQPKKLYCIAGESYPMTLDLSPLCKEPIGDTGINAYDWAEWAIRCFQSQGVYHAEPSYLSLMRSLVPVPEQETSIFDGLQ